MVGAHLPDPGVLVAVQAAVLVGGVERQELPVVVGQAEPARVLLGREARVLEPDAEVAVPADVVVVVAGNRPRHRLLGVLDRPAVEEVRLVLALLARVVDVAEVDHVGLAAGAVIDHVGDLVGHVDRPGQARAPVAEDDQPRVVGQRGGVERRLGVERHAAVDAAMDHREHRLHPQRVAEDLELGDLELAPDAALAGGDRGGDVRDRGVGDDREHRFALATVVDELGLLDVGVGVLVDGRLEGGLEEAEQDVARHERVVLLGRRRLVALLDGELGVGGLDGPLLVGRGREVGRELLERLV